jgi:hypothetical protein
MNVSGLKKEREDLASCRYREMSRMCIKSFRLFSPEIVGAKTMLSPVTMTRELKSLIEQDRRDDKRQQDGCTHHGNPGERR